MISPVVYTTILVMNPDNFNNKTAESITWTLKHPDGHRVTFRVVKSSNVIITNEDNYQFACIIEKARKYWKEYVGRGFVVQNKCVNHDMKKFYDMKRKKEKDKTYSTPLPKHVDDYLKEYMSHKNIHNNDLQEMRINPKKLYTDNWDNYALEA